ncbi:ATP-dependent helicase [Shewanella algae]|uniref:ATP-dependent helicase n=1 Tax=Shewanella algae TaxID=38313 RepID=UPI0031F5BC9E
MTKRLTWEQTSVVRHDAGHALVKAVPGSGKTTTLVKRVERLVKTGVEPGSILILMYNKSATVSFSEKLKLALKSDAIPEVRTFHSLALKIVTLAERKQLINQKTLLTPDNYRYDGMVREAFRLGCSYEAGYIEQSDISDFETFVSRCRASAVTPADAAADPTFSKIKPEFIRAYGCYCELLEANGLRTFEDSMIEAVSLLRTYPGLAARFKHIIVDEYQDVNLVQHEMIRLLTKPDTSVMVVGDLNQCIYEWRGAQPDFMGGLFEQQFPNTTVFQLSCTFRFGHELSLIANSVIRRNSSKLTKLCVSHPSTPKTEVRLHLDNCLSTVLAALAKRRGTHAILSRTNANLAEAELALRLCGYSYRYLNGSSSLYARPEIGLIVVGMQLSVYGDLRLIDNHPYKRDILYGFLREAGIRWQQGQFKDALDALMTEIDVFSVLRRLFDNTPYQRGRLERLASVRNKDDESALASKVLQHLRVAGFIEGVGSDSVRSTASNDRQRGVARIEELLISNPIDVRTFLNLILHPKNISSDSEPITLTTIHGSKGLEWDNVILIGLNDCEFPGGKPGSGSQLPALTTESISNEELEVERRLFYVGITRAKLQLHLVAPLDESLSWWLKNSWDSTPKKAAVATRFIYEAGLTACSLTSQFIYAGLLEKQTTEFSKFHQWYLKDLQRLRV